MGAVGTVGVVGGSGDGGGGGGLDDSVVVDSLRGLSWRPPLFFY